jgi:hypothetical protein
MFKENRLAYLASKPAPKKSGLSSIAAGIAKTAATIKNTKVAPKPTTTPKTNSGISSIAKNIAGAAGAAKANLAVQNTFNKPTTTKTPTSGGSSGGAGATGSWNAPSTTSKTTTPTTKKTVTPPTSSKTSSSSGKSSSGGGSSKKYSATINGKKEYFSSSAEANAALDAWEERGEVEPTEIVREEIEPVQTPENLELENLNRMLGEQAAAFKEQLAAYEQMSNQKVNVQDPQFQQDVTNALAEGEDLVPLFSQYGSGQNLSEAQDQQYGNMIDLQQPGFEGEVRTFDTPTGTMQASFNNGQWMTENLPENINPENVKPTGETNTPEANPTYGYTDDIVEDMNPTQKISAGLNNITSTDGNVLLSKVNALGIDTSNMTSSEMLAALLLQQNLNYADDPTTANYLEKAKQRAADAYQDALDLYGQGGKAVREIDKALDGDDFTPTTYEGLAAKAYSQAKEMNLDSIELEKDYMTNQFNNWMAGETDKRSRLEGYLKAKMYASGAQDSSAGLQTMALAVNAADLRLQSAQNDYNYGISKLNLEARGIMMDYTNNVVKLTMDVQTKKDSAASEYDDKLFQIEGLQIEDAKEKQKLKLDALSNFNDQIYKIEQDRKSEERWWYQQKFTETQAAIDNAYKMSGLSGTYWTTDASGNLVDTGIPTFETQKWKETNALAWAQYQHTEQNDSWNKLFKIYEKVKETNGSSYYDAIFNSSAEQMLGATPGTFAGLSLGELEGALLNYQGSQFLGYQITNGYNALAAANGDSSAIVACYPDGASGGQCGDFMHKFFDLGYSMGDSIQSKVQKLKNTPDGYVPQVGDMVITNEHPTYGHVAIINAVNPDGTITLTESNYYQKSMGPEKVSNTRKLSLGSSAILGYHHGDLKPTFQAAVDSYNQNKDGTGLIGGIKRVTAGLNLAGLLMEAQKEYESNPTIANSTEYKTLKKEIEGVQFPNEAAQVFQDYESGDSNAAKMMYGDPRWMTAYTTWKAQQSTSTTSLQKQSDILGYAASTPTQQQKIWDRAVKGGYVQELQDVQLGDYSGLLGKDAKYTDAYKRLLKDTENKPMMMNQLAQKIGKGDMDYVKGEILTSLRKNMFADPLKTFDTNVQIAKDMKDLADMFKKVQDKTGFVAGNVEKLYELVGRTKDPELAVLKSRVNKLIQTYTKAQSGAQFSAQEFQRYQVLFPGIDSLEELNLAKINEFYRDTTSKLDEVVKSNTGNALSSFRDVIPESEYKTYFMNQGSSFSGGINSMNLKLLADAKGMNADMNGLLEDGYSLEEIYNYIISK